MQRLAVTAVLVLAGLPVAASPALASCAPQTAAEQISRADVIAYGTLTGIRMTFAAASPVVTFRPERVLKGSLTQSIEVFFGPTHGGPVTSVDYSGAPPQAHTLYLRQVDGVYETDVCSGSHEGAPAADEEKQLGRGVLVAAAADDAARPPVAGLAIAAFALVALAAALRWRRRAA